MDSIAKVIEVVCAECCGSGLEAQLTVFDREAATWPCWRCQGTGSISVAVRQGRPWEAGEL